MLKYRYIVISLLLLFFFDWTCASAAIDLLYFRATAEATSIKLEWETAQEINNIGFYIRRSTDPVVGYEQVGDFIPASDDPFAGGYYLVRDYTAKINVLYYYKLEILDASGHSDFSQAVSAIIAGPTSTPTITPTFTKTPRITKTPTISPTPTRSPTPRPSATRIPSITPTLPTATYTIVPTNTTTPTTTLGAFQLIEQVFPAHTLTATAWRDMVFTPTATNPAGVAQASALPERLYLLILVIIILWILLAGFLIFYIRRIKS